MGNQSRALIQGLKAGPLTACAVAHFAQDDIL
jgi:hypothetical protein